MLSILIVDENNNVIDRMQLHYSSEQLETKPLCKTDLMIDLLAMIKLAEKQTNQ